MDSQRRVRLNLAIRCDLSGAWSTWLSTDVELHSDIPPETSMRCPFTQRFSSDSSAAIIGPISSGRPTRPNAVMARNLLIDFRIVAHHPATEVCLDRPRGNHIGCDSTWPQLLGQVTRQYFDCALCRPVRSEE